VNASDIKRVTYTINTVILVLVLGLMAKRFNPIFVSVVVAVCFIVSTAYVRMNGSVYKETILTEVFWNINALTVILFLVYYSSLLVKSIIRSEEQLKKNGKNKVVG